MNARRQILQNDCFAHVFFRCHNRQFFLKDAVVKQQLIWLWAKYKAHYKVNIHDFNVMDNHAHLLVSVKSVEALGHFMRTVNSQLARFINKRENRDSQAIRERYKSPLISNERYLMKTMQYIWLNRYKANRQNPSTDPFCSVCWRLNPDIFCYLFHDKKKREVVLNLLDPYPQFKMKAGELRKFIRDLLNEALSQCEEFKSAIFENGHTVGDKEAVRFRGELLSAFRRERVPIVTRCCDLRLRPVA